MKEPMAHWYPIPSLFLSLRVCINFFMSFSEDRTVSKRKVYLTLLKLFLFYKRYVDVNFAFFPLKVEELPFFPDSQSTPPSDDVHLGI